MRENTPPFPVVYAASKCLLCMMCSSHSSLNIQWGSSSPFITSPETIKARRSGFDINEAPQTFIDAVIVTRHLRLRYLWVDSLCICQNDAEDWARESSRMVDVYSKAYIVVAASRADDCNKGCFHVRKDRPTVIIDLPGGLEAVHATTLFQTDQHAISSSAKGDFRAEPLSTRGWALQERVLARRIVHYNSRQLYFECAAGMLAEDGSCRQSRFCDLSEIRRPESDPYDITLVLRTWYFLLDAYGARRLTEPTDKLPAMSGLARLVQKRTNADYVAGLWSNSMIEGMTWWASGRLAPVSRDEYTGPSWSWASYDGIAYRSTYRPPAICEVLDWHVDLKYAENPFGGVTSAWVRIRGPVAPLRLSKREDDEHVAQLHRAGFTPQPKVSTPYSEDEKDHIILALDYKDILDSGEWRSWDLQVLLLHSYGDPFRKAMEQGDSDASETTQITFGLAVRSEGAEQTRKMQRVGAVFMNGQEASRIRGDETNWRTIILV